MIFWLKLKTYWSWFVLSQGTRRISWEKLLLKLYCLCWNLISGCLRFISALKMYHLINLDRTKLMVWFSVWTSSSVLTSNTVASQLRSPNSLSLKPMSRKLSLSWLSSLPTSSRASKSTARSLGACMSKPLSRSLLRSSSQMKISAPWTAWLPKWSIQYLKMLPRSPWPWNCSRSSRNFYSWELSFWPNWNKKPSS